MYSLFKLYKNVKEYSKINYPILIPFLFLPLVTLFHTIPAFQTLLEAPRSALEGRLFSYQNLMPILHIFTLFIPDFWGNPAVYNYFGKADYKDSIMFIGVIPFVFSLVSIFKRKKKEELFFIVAIIISFIFAIDNPLSKLVASSPLPIIGSFLPNRIFLITTFSLCVVAAYGLDYIIKEKKRISLRSLKKHLLPFF